ncbi:MAG TPA: AzlD domain-containing protein [Caldimonas sp.]
MSGTDLWTVTTIAGMTLVTVLTRGVFFLSAKPRTLPSWLESGFRYAPIAALAAVIVPEMVMSNGHLIVTWRDARLFAAAAATTWYVVRRGLLGTIVAGMAAYLPLHLALGW